MYTTMICMRDASPLMFVSATHSDDRNGEANKVQEDCFAACDDGLCQPHLAGDAAKEALCAGIRLGGSWGL